MDFFRTLLGESSKNIMLLLAIAVPVGLVILLQDVSDSELVLHTVVAGAGAYGLFFWVAAIWYDCRVRTLKRQVKELETSVANQQYYTSGFQPQSSLQLLPQREASIEPNGEIVFGIRIFNWSNHEVLIDKLRLDVSNVLNGSRGGRLGEAICNKTFGVPLRGQAFQLLRARRTTKTAANRNIYFHGEARIISSDGLTCDVEFDTLETSMPVSNPETSE